MSPSGSGFVLTVFRKNLIRYITLKGKDWMIKSIGIDLGVKELAVCSNGMIFENINKTKEVRRLKKKLKSKMYLNDINITCRHKMKNI